MATLPKGMTIEEVEEHLLCACLIDVDVRRAVHASGFKANAFSTELHQAVYTAALECDERGWLPTARNIAHVAGCKPSTVSEYAQTDRTAEHFVPYTYATELVTQHAALRYICKRMEIDRGIAEAALTGDAEYSVLYQRMLQTIETIRRYESLRVDPLSPKALAASIDTSHRWLIPGLLERADRMMIVAPEGTGKSFLLRQWAIMAAAGAHIGTQGITPPKRVLLVDCENSPVQITREIRPMFDLADATDPQWNDRFTIEVIPEGLDLTGRDEQRIGAMLRSVMPDILVIGPLYRLTGDVVGNGWEKHARDLQRVFDHWRAEFDVAILMEHHAGHATDESGRRAVRPMGSSAWMRWPEIGLSLAWDDDNREFTVGRFRGDRGGRRLFPPKLRHSHSGPGSWPWESDWTEARGLYTRAVALIDQERRFAEEMQIDPTTGEIL